MKYNNDILNLCDREPQVWQTYRNKTKILIGSYTCVNYVEYICEYLTFTKIKHLKFDFVLPIFPEDRMACLESKKMKMILEKADRIVVNDVGLLKKYKDKKIRLGRLFFKDYRDQRYEEYDNSEYILKSKMLIETFKQLGYFIDEIECDCITKQMKIYANKELRVYVHFPYRQISCSHICEFSSIGKDIALKFRPDDVCSVECKNIIIKTYEPSYLKVGKSVFDELSEDYIKNLSDDFRMIVTPRWQYENYGSGIIY